MEVPIAAFTVSAIVKRLKHISKALNRENSLVRKCVYTISADLQLCFGPLPLSFKE